MKVKGKVFSAAALLLLILVLAVGFSGCGLRNQEEQPEETEEEQEQVVEDPNLFVSGTLMDTVDISGMTLEEARNACREAIIKKYENVQVTLQINETVSFDLTAEDLVIADTLDFTLSNILKSRKAGQNKITYHLRLPDLQNELDARSAEFNVEGQNASIDHYDYDAEEFVFVESVDGLTVDIKATVNAVIEQFKSRSSGTVQAVMEEAPAEITLEELKESMTLISEYETTSTNTANGDHNMALALSRVDGTVLNPGEIFSFEQKVGNSTTAESGFKPANGLLNGILVPMYGGGICQASTTLYGAVLRAGLTITDRANHSVPSSYVPIGQDAAVSYGSLDFKFRNDLDTPIYIMAWMEGKQLYARIYGRQPEEWDSIEVYSKQTGTLARLDKITYTVDDSLKKGEKVLVSEGNSGYTAEAWRDYIKDGEVIKTEALPNSYYRPTGPSYKIGPGTDVNATPTPKPTEEPTAEPTAKPTAEPTAEPTAAPTDEPVQDPDDELPPPGEDIIA